MSIQATLSPPIPPPLPRIMPEEFRRKLAGLTDPDCSAEADAASAGDYRAAAVGLCTMLATHYSDSLDRLDLWNRIGSALATAAAKVQDGDVARFASLCLEHVKAEDGRVAADETAGNLIAAWDAKPPEWREGWMRYIASRRQPILIFARTAWQGVKEARADARKAASNG